MFDALRALNGPQTMGNGRAFWSAFGLVLLLAIVYPLGFDPYDVGNTAYFLIWIFAALGRPVVGYRTDIRQAGEAGAVVNLQVEYFIHASGGTVVTTADALVDLARAFADGGVAR